MIEYVVLNDLANTAKQAVILDSLYNLIKINNHNLIKSNYYLKRSLKINELVMKSKDSVIVVQDEINSSNMNIQNQYKKELRKSKAKKWFWSLPAAAIGFMVGVL